MGLFDWLRGGARDKDVPTPDPAPPSSPPPLREVETTPRRFSRHRDDLFDIERTGTLHSLFAVDRDARDESWHAAFFDAAWHGSTALPRPTPFTGPDGFAYLRFDVPHPGAFDSQAIGNLAAGLVENGMGAAIFASPDDPEDAAQFVFSMGRLDAMLRFDDAEGDPLDRQDGPRSADPAIYDVEEGDAHQHLTTRKEHQVMIGSPSLDYLPPATARALYRHLVQGWRIAEPRVGLMLDPATFPTRSLVIGRKRADFEEGQDPDGAARMLLWYMTPSQMLMLQPDDMDDETLVPLSRYLGDSAPAND